MVVFHVLAEDATLVGDVLEPMDEFVASAEEFALLGRWRHAGVDEHGRTAPRNIVDRAAERQRAAIDMDDDRLRAARKLCAPLRASQRQHLGGTSDHAWDLAAFGARLGDRLDQPGMIAAEVGEDELHPRLLERIEKSGARRVHPFVSPGADARRARHPSALAIVRDNSINVHRVHTAILARRASVSPSRLRGRRARGRRSPRSDRPRLLPAIA